MSNQAQQSKVANENQGNKTLLIIDKGASNQIRVTLSEYRGQKKIDLRLWWKDQNEDWHPTQKGVSIDPDSLEKLEMTLHTARGIIKGEIKQG